MSEKKIKVMKANEVTTPKRKAPSAIILESLDGDYKTMKDLSLRYGVHLETIRRLCKSVDRDGNPRVNAPSEAVQVGEMVIYLFTPEDVEEMDAYFNEKGYVVNKT